MDNQQDDVYAPRRAELEAQFQGLPPAGSEGYWRRIEELDAANRLPLEVLARCFRERHFAGFGGDADRIFEVIIGRIQAWVIQKARFVASKAKSGMKPELAQDITQECYMKLLEDLASEGSTFLFERFMHKLEYIFDHATEAQMIQVGEWKHRDVKQPTRVPRDALESIDTQQPGEGATPRAMQVASPSAQDDLDLAEYSDLLEEVERLSPEERAILRGVGLEGRTQEDVAQELGVTSRTIRTRLKAIRQKLRMRYERGAGGEGDKSGEGGDNDEPA